MKKYLVLAMIAALAMTGSAFASRAQFVGSSDATFAFGSPATTNNNDSCDIGTTPAATLLLPYFEVDVNNTNRGSAVTTLFTVTNTSSYPQIAHVTVWTDWSYPVLDFNIFLTGYDVQAINLYDVLVTGVVAPPAGTTSNGTTNPPGAFSEANDANPNFLSNTGCGVLPGQLPTGLVADVRTALTTGVYPTGGCTSTRIGTNTHPGGLAVGYLTIDVANNCSTSLPTNSSYYTGEILYDNVLTGDYQTINPNPSTGNYAGGNPLVHIRAIPEGGPAGTPVATNLPYTFYDRYTTGAARTADRRQPLPGVFAARYIQGGAGGFSTNLKIWREGLTGATLTCSAYAPNSALFISNITRFDEHENPTTQGSGQVCSPCGPGVQTLPETSANATTSSVFPNISNAAGDVAGWMYLNLSNNATSASGAGGALVTTAALSAQRPGFGQGPTGTTYLNAGGAFAAGTSGTRATSQNWVITSMFAEGRYSVDFDAAWLANGCTPQFLYTGPTTAAPSATVSNVLVCPTGIVCTPTNTSVNVPAQPYIAPQVNP
jgi:hypothetical protein